MKPSLLIAVVGLAASLLASPVLAKKTQMQNIDFGEITCGEFLQELSTSSAEDAGVVLMWIDGYLSGVSGDTTLDWKDLGKIQHEPGRLLWQETRRESLGCRRGGRHCRVSGDDRSQRYCRRYHHS